MALFMKQEQERTTLQKRIAAELAEKAKNNPPKITTDSMDGVEDSAYMESYKRTTSLAWVWLLVAVVFGGVIVWLVVIAS